MGHRGGRRDRRHPGRQALLLGTVPDVGRAVLALRAGVVRRAHRRLAGVHHQRLAPQGAAAV